MISFPVAEPSQVGAVRRKAVQEGERIGLSKEDTGRLALVVTEAATNLLRHARDGEIVLVPRRGGAGPGIDVIALDDGPGIVDIEAALADGFTTAAEDERGIGGGLGAIRRMSDAFDIYSDPKGTTLVATVGAADESRSPAVEAAGLIVSKPGFEAGGDVFAIRGEGSVTLIMLMDVLGHGPAAAKEAGKGAEAFRKAKGHSLEETEMLVSAALEGGRGAAALFIELPHEPGQLRAAGLGNVRGEITAPDGRRHGIPSSPGILGASSRRPKATEHDWPAGANLVLSTDGLRGAERIPEPTALFFRKPIIVAATLYKRRRRGTDDSGVIFARG